MSNKVLRFNKKTFDEICFDINIKNNNFNDLHLPLCDDCLLYNEEFDTCRLMYPIRTIYSETLKFRSPDITTSTECWLREINFNKRNKDGFKVNYSYTPNKLTITTKSKVKK